MQELHVRPRQIQHQPKAEYAEKKQVVAKTPSVLCRARYGALMKESKRGFKNREAAPSSGGGKPERGHGCLQRMRGCLARTAGDASAFAG